MIRIAGGIYPEISESDYYSAANHYSIGADVSNRLGNSLMYKMCYYRFGEMETFYGKESGFDRVRNTVVGKKNIKLSHMEEAFTSEHWMVRIYRIKKEKVYLVYIRNIY